MCNDTVFYCLNLSQEKCNIVTMANGITGLIIPVISTSLLLGLLLGLRREAWNTPLKRLSLLLCTFFGTNGLVFASVELYNDLLPEVWCKVLFFATGYSSLSISMYFIAVVALLLIQSGAPIVPGHWKHKLKSKLHLYTFWPEFIFHPILHVLSLSLVAVEIFSNTSICNSCEHGQYFIGTITVTIWYIFLLFILTGLFINIILLGYFHIKFCRAPGITRRSKWLLLRLFTLFVSLVSVVVSNSLFYTFFTRFVVEAAVIATILSIVPMLTLLALIYLPNIQCCKSCKRSPHQTRLLPISGTDNTNPPSVWDHNVPSYTFYNLTQEMSDYMTTST